jgi:putative transposase
MGKINLNIFYNFTQNNMKPITYEEYQKKVKNLKTISDVTNFAKELIAPTLQTMLEAEMVQHLGYPKHDPIGNLTGNNRNGYSKKTIRTSLGESNLKIPRDRNGEFEPIAVKKYENTQSDIEEKIIAMYAKGLSTRDIHLYMQDIYGIQISADMVSTITDKVIPQVKEWQSRPLSKQYPFLYLDGIHFKIRDGGKIITKCAYIALGINEEGIKEILGIWIGENEGSKFWMQVLNEIKHRGVEDILIACIDGLKGFPEAIKAIYPDTEIQECIVHQIRNTTKYISYKYKKSFCADLKKIYTASTEELGLESLEEMKNKWPQYKIYLKSWENKWSTLSTFFIYPEQIRKIMYTTNIIENLNRQFRKVTKTTSIFPHNESLQKLLYLAQKDMAKKWTQPIRNWGEIVAQLAIIFPQKIHI